MACPGRLPISSWHHRNEELTLSILFVMSILKQNNPISINHILMPYGNLHYWAFAKIIGKAQCILKEAVQNVKLSCKRDNTCDDAPVHSSLIWTPFSPLCKLQCLFNHLMSKKEMEPWLKIRRGLVESHGWAHILFFPKPHQSANMEHWASI